MNTKQHKHKHFERGGITGKNEVKNSTWTYWGKHNKQQKYRIRHRPTVNILGEADSGPIERMVLMCNMVPFYDKVSK